MDNIGHIDCENLIELLRCFPSLNCLKLKPLAYDSDVLDPFFDLLADPRSTSTGINGASPFLPHLETLALNGELFSWDRLCIIFGPRVSYSSLSSNGLEFEGEPDY